MAQTKKHSLFESFANIAVGFGVALLSQMAIFPLFGIHISTSSHLGIVALFTIVSLVRSYCLRRWFNKLTERKQHANV